MATDKFEIDNSNLQQEHMITGKGNNINFSFKVKRLKDISTFKEAVCIEAYNNNNGKPEYMGKIVCGTNKLRDDIRKLGELGIILQPADYRDLELLIISNYYKFEAQKQESIGNDVPDELTDTVAGHFAGYIKENSIEKENSLYNIPVEDFKKEYEECTFGVPVTRIKEALRLKGYTKCNPNRNDYNIKTKDGKTKRHISFYSDKIDKIIQK